MTYIVIIDWLYASYEEVADMMKYLIRSYDPSYIHNLCSNNFHNSLKCYTATEENSIFFKIKYPKYVLQIYPQEISAQN